MRWARSIQLRLALAISLGVTLLWIAAAIVTATILRHEMDEVFDSALQETAQRILPLAVMDIVAREEEGLTQQLATLRAHDEFFTYIVRDAQGRPLLTSHAADAAMFPPMMASASARRQRIASISTPPCRRRSPSRSPNRSITARRSRGKCAWAWPALLLVIPLSVAMILVAVRLGFRPVRRLGEALATRGAADLSPVPADDLPGEVAPIAAAVNQLLNGSGRRSRRSAASPPMRRMSCAHPVAGALAQAQRLQSETNDPDAVRRGAEIETTLKRLTRLSEKLMQLARAEGGRLRTGDPADLRPILKMVAEDVERAHASGRVALDLPQVAVLSDMDPDAFAILARNLIENALKHGARDAPVLVALSPAGRFSVVNDGVVIAPDTLVRLTGRFERADGHGDGSGLDWPSCAP